MQHRRICACTHICALRPCVSRILRGLCRTKGEGLLVCQIDHCAILIHRLLSRHIISGLLSQIARCTFLPAHLSAHKEDGFIGRIDVTQVLMLPCLSDIFASVMISNVKTLPIRSRAHSFAHLLTLTFYSGLSGLYWQFLNDSRIKSIMERSHALSPL